MKSESKFNYGQIVFLITDSDQTPRMVTGILFSNTIEYRLSCGTTVSWHHESELQEDRDYSKI